MLHACSPGPLRRCPPASPAGVGRASPCLRSAHRDGMAATPAPGAATAGAGSACVRQASSRRCSNVLRSSVDVMMQGLRFRKWHQISSTRPPLSGRKGGSSYHCDAFPPNPEQLDTMRYWLVASAQWARNSASSSRPSLVGFVGYVYWPSS